MFSCYRKHEKSEASYVRERISSTSYRLFSSLRAGNILNGNDCVLLDTNSVWRGEGPRRPLLRRRRDSKNPKTYQYILLVALHYTY